MDKSHKRTNKKGTCLPIKARKKAEKKMKIRLIQTSNQDGLIEEVFFTEDFEADVNDFITPNLKLVIDKVIEADLPTIFPTETTLRKK